MRKTAAKLPAKPGERDLSHGELALIHQIRERVAGQPFGGARGAVSLGIGDDCALLRPRRGEDVAVTTDLSIDGRHFRLGWHPPEAIGHRTLARGLSDLAAMGARPLGAFLSLGLPRELGRPGMEKQRSSWLDRFFDGLLRLADAHSTVLAGGDLAESPIVVADIVLIGAVQRGRGMLRSGARAGDEIYVSGALGGAASALARLGEWAGSRKRLTREMPTAAAEELAAHLYPQPRVQQGLWLRQQKAATAAIDISDGLSTDMTHLCEESGVAAEIDAELLPVHAGATLEQALHGGEDYELLFTARENARIPTTIAGVAVTRIGRVVRRRSDRPQITLISGRNRHSIAPRGWEHFR